MVASNHFGYPWRDRIELEVICIRMNSGAKTPACGPLAAVKRIKPYCGPKMVCWGTDI